MHWENYFTGADVTLSFTKQLALTITLTHTQTDFSSFNPTKRIGYKIQNAEKNFLHGENITKI